jgi:hypothetical protein
MGREGVWELGLGRGEERVEDRGVDGLVEGVEKWKLDVGVRAG